MTPSRRLALTAVAASIVVGLGCSHPSNQNLERAEVEYEAAASDAKVAAFAPLPLEEARASLDRARRAHRAGDSDEEVDHLAYLTSRQVEIAQVAAAREADVTRAEELSRRAPAPVPLAARAAGIEPLLFEPQRDILPASAVAELEQAAAWLRLHPGQVVRVEGHADRSELHPLALSEARAIEVARQLTLRGVGSERLYVVWLGDSVPAASSSTPTGRELNRRVEIEVGPTLGAR